MTLNLISLSNVKTQLGITGPTYDAQLTAMIPIVSADVRRILNCQYKELIPAGYTTGSTELNLYNSEKGYNKYPYYNDVCLDMGQVITGEGIPEDTYIIYADPDTGIFTMSAAPTSGGDYINPTVMIAHWPTIAKMAWYRVSKQTTASASEENVVSKSVGPLSVNFGNSQINKRWNYPQALIDDLGVAFTEVG